MDKKLKQFLAVASAVLIIYQISANWQVLKDRVGALESQTQGMGKIQIDLAVVKQTTAETKTSIDEIRKDVRELRNRR